MVLTQMDLLLDESRFSILLAKNALRLGDRHYSNVAETDELYDNIIHSAMESAMCACLAKE